jgi:DNA polymerase-1
VEKRLLLIDATGLVFRAYYSITRLTAPDGTPVNAVFGLLRMLLKVFRDLPAEAGGVVFDAGAKTFRNEMFAQYKAQRPPPPEDLKPQFTLAIDTVEASNVPVFFEVGFEADDVIATLATQARGKGYAIRILTSDRDILQLLAPDVELLTPATRGEITRHTQESFRQRYGFGVERFVDFKALMGDPSDNIPGIPGVGEKTACRLVTAFGKLEQIYANLDLVKPEGVQRKLREAREDVFLYRELVTLRRDAPVRYNFTRRTLPNFAAAGFQTRLERLGFNRIRRDAQQLGDLQDGPRRT